MHDYCKTILLLKQIGVYVFVRQIHTLHSILTINTTGMTNLMIILLIAFNKFTTGSLKMKIEPKHVVAK